MSTQQSADTRPFLTPDDVAGRLGINRLTVFKLMDQGKIRYVDIATGTRRKHRRTSEAWLAEFLATGDGRDESV